MATDNDVPSNFFDDDLTEDNTTPETWAFLNRPDDEYQLTYEQWLAKHKDEFEDGK